MEPQLQEPKSHSRALNPHIAIGNEGSESNPTREKSLVIAIDSARLIGMAGLIVRVCEVGILEGWMGESKCGVAEVIGMFSWLFGKLQCPQIPSDKPVTEISVDLSIYAS